MFMGSFFLNKTIMTHCPNKKRIKCQFNYATLNLATIVNSFCGQYDVYYGRRSNRKVLVVSKGASLVLVMSRGWLM